MATKGRPVKGLRPRPIITGEKKVKEDHGLPRGTTTKIRPAINPAPKAAPHCIRCLSAGSSGCARSKWRIMVELSCKQKPRNGVRHPGERKPEVRTRKPKGLEIRSCPDITI